MDFGLIVLKTAFNILFYFTMTLCVTNVLVVQNVLFRAVGDDIMEFDPGTAFVTTCGNLA